MFPLREKSNTLVSFRKTRDKDAPPLRLGVIIDGSQPARWIEELLTLLRELPGFEVRLISLRQQQPATAMKNLPWLTDRVYTASKRKFDPFGLVSGNISESLEVSSIDDIGALGCGALLWLAEVDISNVDFRRHTEYGAFRVRFGKNNRGIPFWDEVARNEVTSCVKIYWHESSLDRGRLVRTAETSTVQGLFLTLNAEEPLAATIRTLADLCLCIRDDERQFIERLRGIPVDAAQACDTPDYPSNIEAASFVFKKLTRSAGLRWSAKGKEGKWFLVARPNSGVSISDSDGLNLGGFQEVVFPGEIQAADPFLCENNGRDFLFFEEMATGTSRGRIGYVEVLGNGEYSEMSIVLEKDYHLSYPCIVPANGELFLLPETSQANRLELYRFTDFPGKVELAATLLDGVALVDTTPIFLDDRWYFFTTTLQPFMETLLFWSDKLDGQWNLHPCSPVSCSVRNSRSAGNLFWKNGKLYRPTQDCSVRYGYAIQVNEVIRLNAREFEERPVNWVPPTWSPGLLGTHTWNESNRFQVLDGIRWQAAR